MKKIIFSFSLVLFITLFFLPVKVNAFTFDLKGCRLYIGGEEVTSNKLSGDGWRFDPDTNTIILNDFSTATLGYHIKNENIGHGTYRKLALIYVESPIGSSLDLTICSTGGKTNYLGEPSFAGEFYTFINNYATAFCGIYNPGGNVTITGSTDLIIGTQLTCITAQSLTIDTNSWVYANSHTRSIDVTNMTVKGNGRVSAMAYCASSNTYGYNSTIYAARSLNVYDNAVVSAEMYRDEENDNYAVNAIYSHTINARGGTINARCYANGPKATKGNGIDCIAILVTKLYVSGGAVVEGYLYNTSRNTYVGSAAIGHVYPEDAYVYIQGDSIIRTGVQMKRPSGDTSTKKEALYSINSFKVDKKVYCTVSNNRPKGFENFDRYEERVATIGDGIYFRSNDGVQEWSYFRDFRRIEGKTSLNPNLPAQSIVSLLNNVSEILANNPELPVYVLSGTVILALREKNPDVPRITVEGGTLNIHFSDGKKYNFTDQIEIKEGAKVIIEGDGIAEGLNVIGNGEIKFNGGTVTGSVYKPVDMIVDGGNINVEYYRGKTPTGARNSNGQTVYGRMHHISGDKKYEKINLVRMKNREYGSIGMYPFEGNNICIWTVENDEVTSVRATYLDKDEYKTISLYKNYTNYDLVEATSISTNYSALHSVGLGKDITIFPFNTRKPNISGFNLKWSYSDDGIVWEEIDNSNVDEYGSLVIKNVPLEYNGRQYRCGVYSKYDDELIDLFNTELYVYNSVLACDEGFIDGEEATIRIVPETPVPETLYFRSNWYVSKDGGKNFTFIPSRVAGATDKFFYTFTVEDYMDGWIIKCENIPHIGRYIFPTFLESTITINVTEKKIRIEEQPQGLTFENYNNFDYAELSVKARNVTKYQWQVSKRAYLNHNDPFEDIPGANSPTYKIKMNSVERYMINYCYRCVLTNEYDEVITEVVNNNVYYKPLFSSIESNMSVGIDGKASVVINIDPGNPAVANTVVWMVSRDGAYTFEPISDEIMNGVKYDISDVIMTAAVTKIQYTVFSMLEITNPTEDMNNWVFGAFLYVDGVVEFQTRISLIILSECQAKGHDWLPATCTELSKCSREGCGATTGELLHHTGGVATCIEKAKCEACGAYYGELDHSNHTGTDKWNEEEWEHSNGHESTWSCCGEPKHAFEKHEYHDGICTVCNYICSHQLVSEANCHTRKHCYICQMDYGIIDPNNHDLSIGTYVKDKKDATCEEEGYTGDTICWSCMGCVTPGSVIPAKGHDDSYPATCKEPAYCSTCKKYFGDIDPDNHAEWSYYIKNETTHEEHWNCCSKVTIGEHDLDENGICKVCLYGCKHSGGTADCLEKAICEKCGDPYGEIDHNNHVGVIYYIYDENTHTGMCGCGEELLVENHQWENGICALCNCPCSHTGGVATCIEEATCEKCGEKYGELDHDNHSGILVWNRTSTTHSKKYNCCDTISGSEEAHVMENEVCTICHYGCKHTGGVATCTEKATCEKCGEKYGELLTHNDGNNDHKCDLCEKLLTECSDDNHDHKCDLCEKLLTECSDDNHDHKCDLCEKLLTECSDDNHDHKCDLCEKVLSNHTGGIANCIEEATCEICNKKYGELLAHNDANHDHMCDVCEKVLSECSDDNHDHKCDLCEKVLSSHTGGVVTCTEKATCDVCGEKYGELLAHGDANHDHKCDVCEKVLSECSDANHDHKCDVCEKVLSECNDDNHDHKCDVCEKVLSECSDDNHDHKCDVCEKVLSSHTGGVATCTEKATCDVCGEKYGELLAHSDANNDHKCDACGKVLSSRKGCGSRTADTYFVSIALIAASALLLLKKKHELL